MYGWLIYSYAEAQRNKHFIQFFFEESKKVGITLDLILTEQLKFGVKEGKLFAQCGKPLPHFAVCRTKNPLLTRQLELMGVRTYNNSTVATICNDKQLTYQMVANLGIDTIDTDFVKKGSKYISEDFPKIIKTAEGCGGKNVYLAHSQKEIDDILEQNCHSDCVIQPLVGEQCRDLRVYVIGKQIVGAVLRTAKEGFKSNYSLGGDIAPFKVTDEIKSIVDKISNALNFGLVGIDFLFEKDKPLLNEIEDVVGCRMLYACTDVNIVRLYLDYIKMLG